jgi:hypothetical protein
MGLLQIFREEASGIVTLRLEGVLDGSAAQLICSSLEEVGTTVPVVIDFSHLRQFRDSAVPLLTFALKNTKVRLRGLGDHQARMLRYFGVDTGSLPDREYYRPEALVAAR